MWISTSLSFVKYAWILLHQFSQASAQEYSQGFSQEGKTVKLKPSMKGTGFIPDVELFLINLEAFEVFTH